MCKAPTDGPPAYLIKKIYLCSVRRSSVCLPIANMRDRGNVAVYYCGTPVQIIPEITQLMLDQPASRRAQEGDQIPTYWRSEDRPPHYSLAREG